MLGLHSNIPYILGLGGLRVINNKGKNVGSFAIGIGT
jgi:hypothetical protein